MDYNEIVNGILSKLTNDKKENNEYLKTQIEIYKNHRYGQLIIDELTKHIDPTISNNENIINNNEYLYNQNESNKSISQNDYINNNSVHEIRNDYKENNNYIQDDEIDESVVSIINNSYDYSNIIASEEYIAYLVKYLDQVYKSFTKLIKEDEEKNGKLNSDYAYYEYKKIYSDNLEIRISNHDFNNITCNDYDAFINQINNGKLRNIAGLTIELNVSYKRGKENNLQEHENEFKIKFKPYEISFIRKSNHNESEMNQIENNINEILKKFPSSNSIFCYK